jgi:asparagine N-glycosylation enzyme membrane subunit Stt3
MIMFYLLQFVTYALPVAAVALFIVSLVRYIRARRANRRAPDTYNKRQMTDRLVWLIVTGVITGVMLLMIVGFMLLLMMAVAFM